MQEHNHSDAEKTSAEQKGKKPYVKPTLVVFGDARDRTENAPAVRPTEPPRLTAQQAVHSLVDARDVYFH